MKLSAIIKQYADYIGGTFTDYDESKCIIVVPLKDDRFQTVLAFTEKSKVSGKLRAVFSSKVSDSIAGVDLVDLLRQSAAFDYSKFVIEENHLKIEASCLADAVSEDEVKFMVQEVAQLADQYEYKLTGKDIH
ncbi:MAG TPA: hypothetical protein PLV21_15800 [Cyclobacteriaceae bacterium]|nr:hypothetical protein [Cyclobacteriaceae bacterium]HRJ83349.1 hypothetical protein [Cyclobacteriaceae bacterium]